MNSYTDVNSKTWDLWANEGNPWSVPVTHEEYVKAQNGEWGIYLTPCKTVPLEWFGELKGAKVLGLASGGGQQMPILTAVGAKCTVMDYSDAQLNFERAVAEREKYDIEILKGDMTKRFPFEDESFDLIFHPVSNAFVEDVGHVWNECFRVLKPGGILLAGMDNGLDFLIEDDSTLPLKIENELPYNPLKFSPEKQQELIDSGMGFQFSHTMEEQVGGQLKAGFILTDLYEDRDRDGLIQRFAPQYIATRAVKQI